ncbi:group II intron reverse transcriptase/maturase, partial [Spongiactinospora rosea]
RGWVAFFKYGHSAERFSKIRQYARMRLALFISKRRRASKGFGWRTLVALSPNELGLIGMYGIVVSPWPFKDWRVRPNAGGERRW